MRCSSALLVAACLLAAAPAAAGTLQLPSDPLFVDAQLTNGTEFIRPGVLTGSDTLALTVSGVACILANRDYCTNAAAVVTEGCCDPVGSTQSFEEGGYGALGLRIEGVGQVQLFLPTAATGLGSDAPPTRLRLPATALSALGFGDFSITDARIAIFVIDTVVGDNSGGFTVTQAPAPAAAALFGFGLLAIAGRSRRLPTR